MLTFLGLLKAGCFLKLLHWNTLICLMQFELHILASHMPKIKHQRKHIDSWAEEEFFMVGLLLRKRGCKACVELLNMCYSVSETCRCQSREFLPISKC